MFAHHQDEAGNVVDDEIDEGFHLQTNVLHRIFLMRESLGDLVVLCCS